MPRWVPGLSTRSSMHRPEKLSGREMGACGGTEQSLAPPQDVLDKSALYTYRVKRTQVSTRGVSTMQAMTNARERRVTRPLALVYRGPGGCPGCSEAVAELLHSSHWRFDVQYVGPHEQLKLSA